MCRVRAQVDETHRETSPSILLFLSKNYSVRYICRFFKIQPTEWFCRIFYLLFLLVRCIHKKPANPTCKMVLQNRCVSPKKISKTILRVIFAGVCSKSLEKIKCRRPDRGGLSTVRIMYSHLTNNRCNTISGLALARRGRFRDHSLVATQTLQSPLYVTLLSGSADALAE